ncbi:MAG: flagellar hook capping FlgD N-terminal domain-containing protein [Halieaceae bacterium]|jgi:flagellar basal-body rod modification protein FlgD|nr:flagellar hook capping FlgD N-terminal domain-containing protein [Halieaceae bacterium]
MTSLATINELFPPRIETQERGTNSIDELGSDDFLALMVAQLENQDPTAPMDNMQFIAQLAQFGSVSGIQELNESFSGLASALNGNQGLQAAALVGRSVVTESNLGQLREAIGPDGEPALILDATVDVGGASAGGTLQVQDMSGRLVYSTPLPPIDGDLKVRWDGRDAEGNAMPPGTYRVSADALIDGQSQSVSVHAHQVVQAVAIDSGTGATRLELGNGKNVNISDVKAFL